MPRLYEAMKDVISCVKVQMTVIRRRFPNGATQYIEDILSFLGSEPREPKHPSTWRKRKQK